MDWEEIHAWFRKGMETTDLSNLSSAEAMRLIGQLVDASQLLNHPEGLHQALKLADSLFETCISQPDKATLYYFVGNIHSELWDLERGGREGRGTELWFSNWDSAQAEQVILSYRQALSGSGFEELPVPRRCQILTNLANTLSALGLSLDAIARYDQALLLRPSFGMARGNRALASGIFASTLYDLSHRLIYYRYAYADLATSLKAAPGTIALEPDARSGFKDYMQRLEKGIGEPEHRNQLPNILGFPLGESKEEERYRRWCLRRCLFLNPLNDLGPYPIAAADVLTTPPIVTDLQTGPKWQGAFNQLKQSMVSARYLLYEGILQGESHYSDREVVLYNTLDYPTYGLAIEKVKLAFRSFYSLFDQIGFLLNDFFELGIPLQDINFRTIWYNGRNPTRGVREDIATRPNRPLQALFWLSKNLYEKREGFISAMEPDAQELWEVRNHLEHRYLKVHDMYFGDPGAPSLRAVAFDSLAYSISRKDFEEKAIRLAKLARAALVYLSLAMHVENVTIREKRVSGIAMPMYLDTWEDDWKR